MGPGFFPISLGVILVLVAIALFISARVATRPEEEESLPAPEWRGWILISLSVVAFGVLGVHGGLIPATFAIVFISALGERQNTLKSAVILGLSMVAVAVIVFSWALQINFPLFAWGH